jgi:HlyD family secretion protein
MPRRIRIIVILLVLLIAAGFGVRAWLLHQPFRYAGTIEATAVDISARLASQIDQVLVREGDVVQRDQILVTLTCNDYKISATQAERDFKRARQLRKDGFIREDAFDQFKTAVEQARLRLDWCTIRAPLAATVLTRYREPGEQVGPGVKLLTLGDLTTPWAYVYVEQPLLVKLHTGMDVSGYLPELGGRALPGKIIKLSDAAEFTPKNVQTREERTRLVYGVKIEFANPDGLLKPGMPIEVDLGVQ